MNARFIWINNICEMNSFKLTSPWSNRDIESNQAWEYLSNTLILLVIGQSFLKILFIFCKISFSISIRLIKLFDSIQLFRDNSSEVLIDKHSSNVYIILVNFYFYIYIYIIYIYCIYIHNLYTFVSIFFIDDVNYEK